MSALASFLVVVVVVVVRGLSVPAPVSEVVRAAGLRGEKTRVTRSLSEGFCNEVYEIDVGGARYVAKIYSAASTARVPPGERGFWDAAAGKAGLGPVVVGRTEDALLTALVPASRTFSFAEDEGVAGDVASALRRLHALTPRGHEGPCALWRSIDTALGGSKNDVAMRIFDGKSIAELRAEADDLRRTIETHLGPPDVAFGHGDFKASNVLLAPEANAEANAEAKAKAKEEDPGRHNNSREGKSRVLFVDFELSGPNYALYDVAKLFRSNDAHLPAFLDAYYGPGADFDSAAVLAKIDLCKPVSFFEAAMFFLLMASTASDDDDEARWTALARDQYAQVRRPE